MSGMEREKKGGNEKGRDGKGKEHGGKGEREGTTTLVKVTPMASPSNVLMK